MAEVIEMPRLSDTMTEGVIAAWHVKKGDKVSNGDLLAEVETDKATMDVESFFDGTVLYIGVEEGGALPVGQLLTIIGDEGEDVSALIENHKGGDAAPAAPKEEAAEPAPEPKKKEAAPVKQEAPATAAPAATTTTSTTTAEGRIKASPLAKAMAKEQSIDLSNVQGSGDNGRIVKRDIENYTPPAAQPQSAPAAAPAAPAGQESFEETRVSQMRKTIARRLAESKFSAPHFYVTMEINMGKAVEVRKQLNELSPVKISFNDMVIKAVSVSLRKHPDLNSAWLGDKIRKNHHIHIGMAVAVDEGLLVPVIRHADTKGLSTIAEESKRLAGMARERTLQPSDWEGNTFTVSNLGMFGVEEFTAIINPPDACILAIGGIIDKPIVENGEVVPGKMMKVTLSADHRVVDGAMGAQFLQTMKGLLEDPVRMLI